MKLTIARRLWAMVALSVAALLAVGITGVQTAYSVKGNLDTMTTELMPSQYTLSQVTRAIINLRLALLTHVLADEEGKAAQDKRIAELKTQLGELTDEYASKMASTETDREMIAEDKRRIALYLEEADKLVAASRAADPDAIKEGIETVRKAAINVNGSVTPHVKYNDKLVAEGNARAEAAVARGVWLNLTWLGVGIVAVLALAAWLVRSVTRGLDELRDGVTRVEHSLDMRHRVPVRSQDELGATAVAFNRLLERMQGSLRSVADVARELGQASLAATDTASRLADASSQQSNSAASMAASIEELTVSINHVGDRAAQTNERVGAAGALATQGETVVQQTVDDIQRIADTVQASAGAIDGLEARSESIADVIKVIQDVADQTNLLALNAAIEAARAGEQGRGFAVVADEVRKLAERTAQSTRQITETIGAMRHEAHTASHSMRGAVEQVSQSVTRAGQASEAIRGIGSGARESVSMVAEITDAIREQSEASNSVAQTVERIAQMSEESAAAAQQGAQAAQGLDALARRMHGEVARYTL
ncbi:MAG: methyl-accepting chemotaxis protein [Candidatus Dactylopiibacterium sp.]|nr:methyl-accepting chemotaxis protein [Candidatus Dactylopiibacterium sp.]